MFAWHLALRWLGLRDRAERKQLPKPFFYRLAILVGCATPLGAGVLWARSQWVAAGVVAVAGSVVTVVAEARRDRNYLRRGRRPRR
jgi:Flp pilus assembly protein TadB